LATGALHPLSWGNKSSSYGFNLQFDVASAGFGPHDPYSDVDIILAGGGTTLVFDIVDPALNATWHSYSVPLVEGSWMVGSLGGPIATQAQVQAVLVSLTALRIRQEYVSGSEIGYLDNVILNGAAEGGTVPEPGSAALLLGALGGLMVLRRARHRNAR
jgi:hypothetical protein